MKNFKRLFLIIFILFSVQSSLFSQETELKEITKAIKSADAKTIYSFCENSISLSIPSISGKYSKTQSRQILNQFFKDHPVKEIKELKSQSEDENNYYSIIEYSSDDQRYTIYVQLKKQNSHFLIHTIQIQKIKL